MTTPAPAVAVPTVEKGRANNSSSWWGTVENEHVPELQWPLSIDVFDKMRRSDAQCASVLRAVSLPVRRTQWRIDPAESRPEIAAQIAQDLGLPLVGSDQTTAVRTRDRFSWSEHLRLALLMLPFGHMYFEQVARYDDEAGIYRLRKLAPRLPRSITGISVAKDGGLEAIQQGLGTSEPIPVSQLVAYIHDREGGNWFGQSLLRPAYKHWLLKDRLLRTQTATIDRNGMGVPRYTGAEGETDLSAGQNIATKWRSGESSGASIPFGAKLDLVGVTGTLPDADPAIRYHDEQIARAVLAHFLNLGTQTGSWALGSTFADFFVASLQTLAEQIRDTTQQHVIEDMVDWNYGPLEPAPQLVFEEIGSRTTATADAIKSLVDAGVIFPDRLLEETVRQHMGLPAKDPQTSTATAPPTNGGAA